MHILPELRRECSELNGDLERAAKDRIQACSFRNPFRCLLRRCFIKSPKRRAAQDRLVGSCRLLPPGGSRGGRALASPLGYFGSVRSISVKLLSRRVIRGDKIFGYCGSVRRVFGGVLTVNTSRPRPQVESSRGRAEEVLEGAGRPGR